MYGIDRIGTHLYERRCLHVVVTATTGPTGALSTLPSAGLAERRPTAYARWLTNRTAPCKQGGVRRRVRRRYLSMDRLYSISRELLSGPFGHIFLSLSAFILSVRSCLARTVVLRLPRNSCKGVQRYHYPSLVRPEWRLRISEIRNRQSAPRVIPNLAKPSKSFLSEESVPLKN